MGISVETRLGVSPARRGRMWLCFHDSDRELVKSELVPELLKIKDCAIYYGDDVADKFRVDWDLIRMVVVLVSEDMLTAHKDQVTVLFAQGKEKNVPVLPILIGEDPSLKALFAEVLGKLQRLVYSPRKHEEFEKKMRAEFDKYFAGDDLRRDVIRNFRKKAFLSYRTKDRAEALRLMRAVHEDEGLLDVAVWFDGNLIVGKKYDKTILRELDDADLFLLAVTPGVLEKNSEGQDNYVVRIELPEARKQWKPILAVEVAEERADVDVETGAETDSERHAKDSDWREQLGLEPSQCVCMDEVCAAIGGCLGRRGLAEMTTEEIFLLGIAYHEGILVEKDMPRGIGLLRAAAADGYVEALRRLEDIYFYGIGTPVDYDEALECVDAMLRPIVKQGQESAAEMDDALELEVRDESTEPEVHDEASDAKKSDDEKTVHFDANKLLVELKFELMEKTQYLLDRAQGEFAFEFARRMLVAAQIIGADDGDLAVKAMDLINESRAWCYMGDVSWQVGRADDALECARVSCELLERLQTVLKPEDAVTSTLRAQVHLDMENALAVNYDHYADYLIKTGRREEAEAVLEKRRGLRESERETSRGVNGASGTMAGTSGQRGAEDDVTPRSETQNRGAGDFYSFVRRADICMAERKYAEAAELMETAVKEFEEVRAASGDWETILQKATALDKLASAHVMNPDAGDEALERALACANEAREICDQVLGLDKDNDSAMRERAICLEVLGHYYRRKRDTARMAVLFKQCEEARKEIYRRNPSEQTEQELLNFRAVKKDLYGRLWDAAYKLHAQKHLLVHGLRADQLPFSTALQESRLMHAHGRVYFLGSFVDTKDRVENENADWEAVLAPTPGTSGLLSGSASYPDEAMKRDCRLIYPVPTKSVLRMLRKKLVGEEYNLGVSDIGAELLIGVGRKQPNQRVILYELADNYYRTYYVLFFSLPALEMKAAELCCAGLLDPSCAGWRSENMTGEDHFCADSQTLGRIVIALADDYFSKALDVVDIVPMGSIFAADPKSLQIRGVAGDVVDDAVGDVVNHAGESGGEADAAKFYCFAIRMG